MRHRCNGPHLFGACKSCIPCVAYVMSRVTRVPDLNHLECLPVRAIFSRGYTSRITTIVRGQNMEICHSLRCKLIDMPTTNIDVFKICQFVDDLVELKSMWQRAISIFWRFYLPKLIFFPHKTVINLSALQRKSHFIFKNICFWFRLFLFSCRKWH